MLLRSSSTPVLGSLLTSIAESPSNNHHHELPNPRHTPTSSIHQKHNNKVTYCCPASQTFTPFLRNPSPISPSVAGDCSLIKNGFRRAQSEGNLEKLANSSSGVDELSLCLPMKVPSSRPYCVLESIPSRGSRMYCGGEESDEDDEEDEEEEEEEDEFCGNGNKLSMSSSRRSGLSGVRYADLKGYDYNMVAEEGREEMHLARGLGVADICYVGGGGGLDGVNGGGSGCRPVAFGGDGGESEEGVSVEEHYERMLEEDPSNPLLLRNYAQFLYQTKRDLQGAEVYFSRAILADQKDGEILSQYAKLVWELHQDKERAISYFERAIQASSHDSHVHAAYASFLWEIEDDENESDTSSGASHLQPLIHKGFMVPAST